jgi:hypothetical protein
LAVPEIRPGALMRAGAKASVTFLENLPPLPIAIRLALAS